MLTPTGAALNLLLLFCMRRVMAIRAAIFDVGGVLLFREDKNRRRKWEKYLGLSEGELPKIVYSLDESKRALIGQASVDEVWQQVAIQFGLNSEQSNELRYDFWWGDQVDPEMSRFIKSLHPRYKTALLSNAWSNAREIFVQKLGLDKIADILVISAEEGLAKPDIRIFQITAERLNIQPEEIIFVDDILENVQSAQTIGIRGIQFSNIAQVITEIQKSLDEGGDI
jgi:putative hydrolase of the HAD superfamily